MTTDPKPVTEEELDNWEHALRAVDELGLGDLVDREVQERELRLIAAVREARAQNRLDQDELARYDAELIAAESKHNACFQALEDARYKLAEIRAVVAHGMEDDWHIQDYLSRLHEVIGE